MVVFTRDAAPDDLPTIKHLLAHNNVLRWPVLPLPDATWKSRLEREANGALVAVADEVVVGFTAVEVSARGAEAGRLAVSDESAVPALLQAAESHAREQGAGHLTYRLVGGTGPLREVFLARGYEEAEGWPEYERFDLAVEPNEEIEVRTLMARDLDEVVEIDRLAFGEMAYPKGFVELMLTMPAYRLLGVERGGKLVAFSASCLLPDGVGYFMKTATRPEGRGAGLAGALCAAVIGDFRDAGAARIWAHTWDGNYRGMHLLEKYQFRRTGRSVVMRRKL